MIKKWLKHYVLRETIKEIELNRILDKISNGENLNDRENGFLDLYNQTQDSDYKDFSFLSRQLTIVKIQEFLDKKKKVYCDLYDRDGKIGQLITAIDKISFKLIFRHSDHFMEDRYLYNLTYDMKKDLYSLTSQDEYFEELLV
jgi:hypothetical protein